MKKGMFSIAMISLFLCAPWLLAQESADTVLYNAKVLTVDSKSTIAEAVAIKDNRIAAVGKNDDIVKLAGPNTLKIDLKGRTVIPGLIHTHTHVDQAAGSNYGSEVGPAKLQQYPLEWKIIKTKDDVLKQLKSIMTVFKFKPGEWVYVSSEMMDLDAPQLKLLWAELTRFDLDKVTPDNPVVLSLAVPSNSGYMVNSKAWEILEAKYGDFMKKYGRVVLGADGKPDGHLEPPAGRLAYGFLTHPNPADLAGVYKKPLEEFSAEGVTTVSTRLADYAIDVYKYIDSQGELPTRLAYGFQSAFDTPDPSRWKDKKMGEGTDSFWLNSFSAGMVDGAGFGYCTDLKRDNKAVPSDPKETGAVLGYGSANPMAEWYPRGWCNLDIEFKGGPHNSGAPLRGNYFDDWFNDVARYGQRSANIHVGGDASHSRMLSMMERIDAIKPGAVKGWGMDHCALINPSDIPRAAKLGIMFSCNPNYVDRNDATAKVYGEKVAHTFVAPIKTMLDAGINVSLEGEGGGSFWGSVETLITRKDRQGKVWGPQERLDRATALRVTTMNAARYVLKGDQIGSIEKGKLADMTVLSDDYMKMPEENISELRSLMTILGGKIKYLNPDFSQEYNLKPAGALIKTFDELVKRRKRFPASLS